MTIALQPFKLNDTVEAKVVQALIGFLEERDSSLDDFYNGANECAVLGDVLYALDRDPMPDTDAVAVI